jgi:hypothetical protein
MYEAGMGARARRTKEGDRGLDRGSRGGRHCWLLLYENNGWNTAKTVEVCFNQFWMFGTSTEMMWNGALDHAAGSVSNSGSVNGYHLIAATFHDA